MHGSLSQHSDMHNMHHTTFPLALYVTVFTPYVQCICHLCKLWFITCLLPSSHWDSYAIFFRTIMCIQCIHHLCTLCFITCLFPSSRWDIHPTCHFCTLRFMINTLGNIFAPGLIYSGHVLVFASGVTNFIGLVLIQVHTKCSAQVTHDILHSSVNYWHASAKAARICSRHAANFILVRIYFAAWPFTPVCQKDIMLCLHPLLFWLCPAWTARFTIEVGSKRCPDLFVFLSRLHWDTQCFLFPSSAPSLSFPS